MKKLLLLILFNSFLLLFSGNCYAVTQWCDDGNALGCYNAETGLGETLVDQSSNNNDGTFIGAGEPAWDNADVPDAGDGFNGTSVWSNNYDGGNDYIDLGDVQGLDGGTSVTICMWANPDSLASDQRAITRYTPTAGDQQIVLWMDSGGSGAGWAFQVKQTDVILGTAGENDSNATVNVWQHVCGVYDGSNVVVSVDGVAGTSASFSGTLQNVTQPIYIGRMDLATDQWFNGGLDEIVIFSDAKNSTDRDDIMANGLVQGAAPAARRFFTTTF